MIEVCQLSVSTLYLFRDQLYKGRCIVAFNSHKTELFELDPNELDLFSQDLSIVANAIHKAFGSNKINYAAYGDLVPHLHFHLVPKYIGGECWGKAFEMNSPNKVIPSESEYNEIINSIKAYL